MGKVKIANFLQSRYLLRFSLTRQHWSLEVNFPIAFFAAFNQNYRHKQWTIKHTKTAIK